MTTHIQTIMRGIILGLSITAPIGPTNIEIIRRGTRYGWRAAVVFCLGVMIALILYLCLVGIGLTFLIQSSIFNIVLSIAGIVVLGFLSYSSIKDFFIGVDIDKGELSPSKQHFLPGIIMTISNPAILVLWTGIMGADLASSDYSAGNGLFLSAGILVGVALFFTAITLLIHFSRKILLKHVFKYISLVAGLILAFFCLRIIWQLILKVI
jgi:threonine/homoserine/homoserine lactone efflux protein